MTRCRLGYIDELSENIYSVILDDKSISLLKFTSLLKKNYRRISDVKKLIKKGNISILCNTPEQTQYFKDGMKYDIDPTIGSFIKNCEHSRCQYAFLLDEENDRWKSLDLEDILTDMAIDELR